MTERIIESEREGLVRVAPKPKMALSEPVLEFPLSIEETTDFNSPIEKFFVLAHLGVPEIELDSWSFDVTGLVDSPYSLRFEDLSEFKQKTVHAIHHCAGNPLEPTASSQVIANVEWRGVLLRDILQQAQISADCRYLWAYGLDYGSFYGTPYQEHYVKDLPIEYVMNHDVIVATHLNGEPLSPNHGFPARIVAPGYYGTNSVKWLCRIEARERRANAYFTNELYNDPIPGSDTRKPVWEIEPQSIIVNPTKGSELKSSNVLIEGWAWSSTDIESVDVSIDGGETWSTAEVERRLHASWQRFHFHCPLNHSSHYELLSRATDVKGRTQPLDGARNSVHRVGITIVDE